MGSDTPALEAPGRVGPARVLVVDDEPDVCETMCLVLQSAGYATQAANSGREAIRAVARARPDLVVLDLMMPELSGFTVLRGLRRLCRRRAPPVVVCSGYPQLFPRALEAGARGVLEKPFDVDHFLDVVQKALG